MQSNEALCELKYVDPDYNLPNRHQFKLDAESLKFTKICMTEVVNADMMIATFGEDRYANGCRDVLLSISNALVTLCLDDKIALYSYNYKNFLLAAGDSISDNDFKTIMRSFYDEFERATSEKTELSGISRFVLVFGGTDLIDHAKSALYSNKKSQTNFIISSNEKEIMQEEIQKSVKMFDLLNYAITSDKIVPYYQGIHNNKLNATTKYEALMRIFDAEGNIYNPSKFLDTAKQFKLYTTISKILINKALNDFENRQSELSINISLYDVEQKGFVNWFFNRLESFPDPSRLTLEFVETENYNKGNELYLFLNKAREFGCKIAVDDFGVGFATYTSIISLRPEIIKIDGDIVSNINFSEDNKIILESICYMAKLINATTVAEFVESESIQKTVVEEHIDYSQGYYFSKPQAIENLEIL